MKNKGAIGKTFVTFIAILVIAGILILFIVVSGVVKNFSNINKGISVQTAEDVGVLGFGFYMKQFNLLSGAKFKIAGGGSFVEIINFYFDNLGNRGDRKSVV